MLGWTGGPEQGQNIPYLLAYSLGDGEDGPEAGEAAARALIEETGLSIGGKVLDCTRMPALPIKLLVEGGQWALSMPHLTAQCDAPADWLQAVEEYHQVYFLFATRPWPEATLGSPVTEDMLNAFVADEKTFSTAAHCLLPVTRLRK